MMAINVTKYVLEHKLTESGIMRKLSIVTGSFVNLTSVRANETFVTVSDKQHVCHD